MPTYTSVKIGQLFQKLIHVRGGPTDKQLYGKAGRWANTHTCMHMQYGDLKRPCISSEGGRGG